MNWMIENWYLLIGALAIIGAAAIAVRAFLGQPSEEQVAKVKQWLIWACVEAEKALQSGTGQVKLRHVYDMFCAVPAFTWMAKVISFETFSLWVAESLQSVKEMIVSNDNLAEYIYGEHKQEEVDKIKAQLST